MLKLRHIRFVHPPQKKCLLFGRNFVGSVTGADVREKMVEVPGRIGSIYYTDEYNVSFSETLTFWRRNFFNFSTPVYKM